MTLQALGESVYWSKVAVQGLSFKPHSDDLSGARPQQGRRTLHGRGTRGVEPRFPGEGRALHEPPADRRREHGDRQGEQGAVRDGRRGIEPQHHTLRRATSGPMSRYMRCQFLANEENAITVRTHRLRSDRAALGPRDLGSSRARAS